MAYDPIVIGTVDNDDTGDAPKPAAIRINNNFASIDTQLAAKAPLASPTFTGVPAGPTAAVDTNTTQLATTAGLMAQIGAAQVSAIPQFERATTGALALTRATHQGSEITLSASGATISFSATTQGNGFSFLLRNRTGAALTVPTFTGGTNEYRLGAAHTQVMSGGDATFTVYTRNSTMYVAVVGDTQ